MPLLSPSFPLFAGYKKQLLSDGKADKTQIRQTGKGNKKAEIRNYLFSFAEGQQLSPDLSMAPSVFGLKHTTEHFKLY